MEFPGMEILPGDVPVYILMLATLTGALNASPDFRSSCGLFWILGWLEDFNLGASTLFYTHPQTGGSSLSLDSFRTESPLTSLQNQLAQPWVHSTWSTSVCGGSERMHNQGRKEEGNLYSQTT